MTIEKPTSRTSVLNIIGLMKIGKGKRGNISLVCSEGEFVIISVSEPKNPEKWIETVFNVKNPKGENMTISAEKVSLLKYNPINHEPAPTTNKQ